MPNAIDIVRRLADNVYTTPYDKTRDTALLALIIAAGELGEEEELPDGTLALPPREMLKVALGILEDAAEAAAEEDSTT